MITFVRDFCRRHKSVPHLSPLLCLLAGWRLGDSQLAAASDPLIDEMLNRAQAAQLKGDWTNALALATEAIKVDPRDPQCYYVRGRFYALRREHAQSVADFDQALALEPRAAEIYQLRGVEQFKLAHFRESVTDFDKVLELKPKQAPYLWQRGIACYYAGRYEEGRKQFELHQTVNSNDVENAVWHFLCVARSTGLEQARDGLIKVKADPRLPMMKIHALFAGEAGPEEVLTAARAGYSSRAQLKQQLFYAHLYLGLYFEAIGDPQLSREHIFIAAKDPNENDYMGEVARVHAECLRQKEKDQPKPAHK